MRQLKLVAIAFAFAAFSLFANASTLTPVVHTLAVIDDDGKNHWQPFKFCLAEQLRPSMGKSLSALQLYALQQQLTLQCFVNAGYVSSGVTIPPQTVRNGQLRVDVQLGQLTGLVVDSPAYPEKLIKAVMAPLLNKSLHLPSLRAQLLRLEQEPGISAVHADVQPTGADSRVVLQVVPAVSRRVSVQLDNHQPISIGEYAARLSLSTASLTGNADAASAQLELGEGVSGAAIAYRWPINPAWQVISALEYRKTSVVEEPFNEVDIESRLVSGELGFAGRWLPRPELEWRSSLVLERRQARSFLLGQPFSFAEGPVNGRSDIARLRWRLSRSSSWVKDGQRRAQLQLLSTVGYGLRALGATHHDDDRPDGEFISWQGEANGLLWFGGSSPRWFSRGNWRMQLVDDSLLPVEQFGVGGYRGVRGYRENSVVRDQGMAASLSLGHVFQRSGSGRARLSGELFYDIGRAADKSGRRERYEYLASVGTAVNWRFLPQWQLQASLALPLRERPNAHKGLQDEGLHFSLRYEAQP